MNCAPRFQVRKVREIQLTYADWLSFARDLSRGLLAGRSESTMNAGKSGKFRLEKLKKKQTQQQSDVTYVVKDADWMQCDHSRPQSSTVYF